MQDEELFKGLKKSDIRFLHDIERNGPHPKFIGLAYLLMIAGVASIVFAVVIGVQSKKPAGEWFRDTLVGYLFLCSGISVYSLKRLWRISYHLLDQIRQRDGTQRRHGFEVVTPPSETTN